MNLVVPEENILGGLGEGFAMGQHRLGYGRLRHGMWSIAKAQAALDMATGRAIERVTFGERLADRQGIQWMLAECAEKLYITRLMILHIAYKMDRGLDLRQENSIAKTYIAHMLQRRHRHRHPDPRLARLHPRPPAGGMAATRPGRTGSSTAPTRSTAGRSAATSSRRSSSPARPQGPQAATSSDLDISLNKLDD